MQFQSTVDLDGKTATGVPVPDDIVMSLSAGNRPRVRVTLAGHSYSTTVARVRGQFKFPVSAAVREQTGLRAGDQVEVQIALDTAPRELPLPADLLDLLEQHPEARRTFDALSYTNRKRHVVAVEGAKKPETRERRLAQVLDQLHA